MNKTTDHKQQMFDPAGNWCDWDGIVELHQTWTDWSVNAPSGEVMHVTEESPAPAGTDTSWSVYGHLKEGGVFHIADFEFSDHDSAMKLVNGLEHVGASLQELNREVARLDECMSKPVGYINQGDLEDLRVLGEVADVTLSTKASGYHNVAIYAQD